MKQLTPEQKRRILATYLFQYVVYKEFPHAEKMLLIGVGTDDLTVVEYWRSPINNTTKEYLLLLRTIGNITDEDAAEVARLGGMGSFAADRIAEQGRILLIDHMNNNRCAVSGNEWISIYQYLTQKGYAVPIFIAPGHPNNGMTAIEMGLAIEAK